MRQLARSPTNRVIAACRNSDRATALHSLTSGAKGDLHVLELDVGDPASIRDSVKTVEHILGDSGLDYLYNNAGVVRVTTAALSNARGSLMTLTVCGRRTPRSTTRSAWIVETL